MASDKDQESSPDLNQRLDALEADQEAVRNETEALLIRQEHRLIQIVLNLLRWWRADRKEPRRRAAVKAFIFYWLSPRGAARAGISVVAIAGLYLAIEANSLLRKQNDRLEESLHLMESERRAALVFELSAIYDRMGEELRPQRGIKGEDTLSRHLTARIISVSRSFRPYLYMESGGDLTQIPLSPERGQLLSALHLSGLCTTELLYAGDFRFMDLSGVDLRNFNPYLPQSAFSENPNQWSWERRKPIYDSILTEFPIDFSGSNFSQANLRGANFAFLNLSNTYFIGADLREALLTGTDLHGADLFGATICEKWKPMLEEQGFTAEQLAGINFIACED